MLEKEKVEWEEWKSVPENDIIMHSEMLKTIIKLLSL